jgi:hypothetical protein
VPGRKNLAGRQKIDMPAAARHFQHRVAQRSPVSDLRSRETLLADHAAPLSDTFAFSIAMCRAAAVEHDAFARLTFGAECPASWARKTAA